MLRDFNVYTEYIPFAIPVNFDNKFEAIGYFPYERATINYFHVTDNVCPPRTLFKHIEDKLPIKDNKFVVIFRDLVNFGTDDFAIAFKDCYCKMGSWKQVQGYAGRILPKKRDMQV